MPETDATNISKADVKEVIACVFFFFFFPLGVFFISGLIFHSLIHFEFIFVYGVRKWSSFIFFLHIAV